VKQPRFISAKKCHFGTGAAEQLRLYASILGVGFQTVETPLALAQALEEQRRKDLVFIDTPGWTHRDSTEIHELANYLANDPDIDVHLVLPASNRACDLARVVDRYAMFQPRKLLFTRIDETGRHGPLLNESCRTGKPVSFLSAGEQIPEDVEPATPARIAELVLGPLLARENAPGFAHLEEVK
jgi:flagellar biosynthesis protein FlhF